MSSSTGLRQRKSGSALGTKAAAAGDAGKSTTVTINTAAGHLGVTLCNNAAGLGAEIEDAHQADLVAKAGLRMGDVITAVGVKKVKTHEEAMALINEAAGGEITLEYMTAADVKAKIAADRAASRAFWCGLVKKVFKTLLVLLTLAAGAAAAAYKFLPQDQFKDKVDMQVLPKFGFKQPEMGYDMRPKRVPIKSSDPTKPWKVPGWNRQKEMDAMAKVKKSMIWKMKFGHMDSPDAKPEKKAELQAELDDMMEQIRSSGGDVLDKMMEMDKAYENEMKMFADMAKNQGGGIPGMEMPGM